MAIEGKIIQFQIVQSKTGDGETIYVLTDAGHLYSHVTGKGSGEWTLMW